MLFSALTRGSPAEASGSLCFPASTTYLPNIQHDDLVAVWEAFQLWKPLADDIDEVTGFPRLLRIHLKAMAKRYAEHLLSFEQRPGRGRDGAIQ